MMPLSFNITIMNSESMISKIVEHRVTLDKIRGAGGRLKDSMGLLQSEQDHDLQQKLAQIKQCVKLELIQPATIWPYFGNLRVKVTADNSDEKCRMLE